MKMRTRRTRRHMCREEWLASVDRVPFDIRCSNDVDTGNRRRVLETQSRFTHDATILPRKKRRHVYVHATEGCTPLRSAIYSRFILFILFWFSDIQLATDSTPTDRNFRAFNFA